MGILSDHHAWAVAFGVLGNIISVLVYLAPVPTFYRIYKKKSTESFQSVPYQVALFSSMLWLYYALLKKDAFLLVTINSFGCFIETIYITLFFSYASKPTRVSSLKLFAAMNMGLFSSILIVTHFLVKDPQNRIVVLGWVCVAVSVSVFAAPLSIVARVVRTKSVEFMPVNLSFFLTITAVIWFSYGMFIKDLCVALPNVIGFILGILQMSLYALYRRNSGEAGLEINKLPLEKEENLKSVIVLSPLGTAEVYPIDVKAAAGCGGQLGEEREREGEKQLEKEGAAPEKQEKRDDVDEDDEKREIEKQRPQHDMQLTCDHHV